jgi:hypothetical protein
LRQLFILLLCVLFILNGCSFKQNKDTKIIDYEYLSLNEHYSEEVNQWLIDAKRLNDERVYSLSSKDGNTYVYAKGHKQAKVSYLYENTEGKINRILKVTLLKGNSSNEVLIMISIDSDLCCDVEMLDVTEHEDEFYAK